MSIKAENAFLKIVDGVYHTSTLKAEEIDDTSTFYKGVFNELNDKEVAFVYDDNSDENTAYLFYKSGEKLYADYLYEYNGQYYFSNEYLYWYTEYHRLLTATETVELITALKDYCENNANIPLNLSLTAHQKRLCEFPPKQDNLTEKEQEKVKFIAKTVKSGLMLVALLAITLTYGLTKNTTYMLLALGATFLVYGSFLILAVKLRFRFAYCVIQLFKKQFTTPNEINWDYFTFGEKYGFILSYIVIGFILAVASTLIIVL